jgi:membrane-associated phospholipid phosphatase
VPAAGASTSRIEPAPASAHAATSPAALECREGCEARATIPEAFGFSTLPLFAVEDATAHRDERLAHGRKETPLLASPLIVASPCDADVQPTSSDTRPIRLLDVVAASTERATSKLPEIVERGGGATTLDTQEPNPLPEHTGFKSLAKDTVSDLAAFPRRRSTWVILAGGLGAAVVAHQADDYVAEHIVGSDGADKFFKPGKVIGSAGFQTGTALGLWLVGRYVVPKNEDGSRSNRLSHLGLDLLRAQIVSQAMVHAIKYTVRRDRPTGECCAFPSGHATSAFSSAAVFERHFGERGSWWALTTASYVAASRLVDNRHFLSDVVFGAALGEAVGWTVVGRHGRDRYVLRAFPMKGGGMIAITNN